MIHEGRALFRMSDDRSGATPAMPIEGNTTAEIYRAASVFNEQKFGIFWTVNEFTTAGDRKKENLKRIISWTADIDTGTKEEQMALIRKYPMPTAVVETKRGFQVYYDAIDAKPENYELIETKFIVPSLNGDLKARDLSRILRVPHFLHWKDPANPFFVKLVHECKARYTEAEIMTLFDDFQDERKEITRKKTIMKQDFKSDVKLFDRIWAMDCEAALERLSGSNVVNGEVYSFKRNTNGNKNIFVNGKGTSCFIDREGRIGSLDGGGPTIYHWLKWYGRTGVEAINIIKNIFPEVAK